jgi:hypothetical protein
MTETDQVSETLCSLKYGTMYKVQKPSNPERYTPEAFVTLFLFRTNVQFFLLHTNNFHSFFLV